MVGQVGVEPTVFQMSQIYSLLQSPTMLTDPCGGERRTRTQCCFGSTHRLASASRTFRVRSPYGWDGWIRTIDAGFRDRCRNRLATSQYGRGRANRTPNLRFWRPLLYQLSYTPE